jgi:hypothetical protein
MAHKEYDKNCTKTKTLHNHACSNFMFNKELWMRVII